MTKLAMTINDPKSVELDKLSTEALIEWVRYVTSPSHTSLLHELARRLESAHETIEMAMKMLNWREPKYKVANLLRSELDHTNSTDQLKN